MGRPALYFAFGSNLDEYQLRRRCPSATLVGPAVLRDHRIGFAGQSRSRGGGVATVIPLQGARVQGLVFALAGNDLERLDLFEGAPAFYERRAVQVHMGKKGTGRRLRVVTYVLDRPEAPPATPYLTLIGRAYRRLGFRYGVLFEAVEAAFSGIDLPLSVRGRFPGHAGPGRAARPPVQEPLPLGLGRKRKPRKARKSKG